MGIFNSIKKAAKKILDKVVSFFSTAAEIIDCSGNLGLLAVVSIAYFIGAYHIILIIVAFEIIRHMTYQNPVKYYR